MRIHHSLGASLTVGLGLSGLVLAAGCSAAPPGATSDSPAIGPVRAGAAAKTFTSFPVSASWNGLDNAKYAVVAGAKTGTKPREFGFTAKRSMVFWLSCIGTGTASLTSPAIGLKWGVPCGDGADPQGLTYGPPAAAQGKPAKVLVTAPAGARWEVRVDAEVPDHATA